MNRLKELRLLAGLSQEELAKKTETTQRNISYWESGKIEMNLSTAIKIAQFFQVEVEYLSGYMDDFGICNSNVAPMGERLTAEERKLIEEFRKLLPETQEFIVNMVKSYNHRDKSI